MAKSRTVHEMDEAGTISLRTSLSPSLSSSCRISPRRIRNFLRKCANSTGHRRIQQYSNWSSRWIRGPSLNRARCFLKCRQPRPIGLRRIPGRQRRMDGQHHRPKQAFHTSSLGHFAFNGGPGRWKLSRCVHYLLGIRHQVIDYAILWKRD